MYPKVWDKKPDPTVQQPYLKFKYKTNKTKKNTAIHFNTLIKIEELPKMWKNNGNWYIVHKNFYIKHYLDEKNSENLLQKASLMIPHKNFYEECNDQQKWLNEKKTDEHRSLSPPPTT